MLLSHASLLHDWPREVDMNLGPLAFSHRHLNLRPRRAIKELKKLLGINGYNPQVIEQIKVSRDAISCNKQLGNAVTLVLSIDYN